MSPRPKLVLVNQRTTLPWVFEAAERVGVDIVLVPRHDEVVDPAKLPPVVVECLPLQLYTDPAGAIAELARRHAESPFAGILSGCDPAVPFVARAAAELGLPGLALEAAEVARDKRLMRERLRAAGLNTPGFVAITAPEQWELAARLEFPVVVKPANGYGSFGVTKVDSVEELARTVNAVWAQCGVELDAYSEHPEQLLGLVVEEYLDGPEISVESLAFQGEVTVVVVSDKGKPVGPYFEEVGFRSPAVLPEEVRDEIVREVAAAHAAFGITDAATHTELRLHRGRPHLLEMGARIGGGGMTHQVARIVTGIDYAAETIRILTGQRPHCWGKPIEHHGHCGGYIVPCGGHGRIVAVHGIAELHEDPRVDYAVQMLWPGDVVRPYPDWSGYPAFIMSHHDSDEQTAAFHRELDERIRLDYEDIGT
ncbi:hypothetical protein GCM10010174_60620 [Kutzneria viridogrisea]|uniref:ATP-grasp domain-containing protein n=1 Tax=Kutzneria viridogrisea TaxID=47990 RepID=A0ABR6BJP2_9PSEU|nr:hypothetical protein [Kutzneria viridogrisea]